MRIVFTALCLLWASVVVAVAPAAPDPWRKVPRPPTACYTSQDKYYEEIDAAIEAMNSEIYRQDEINKQIEEQLTNLDPMEKQSRMQNYLMQNPQEAAKFMQAAQAQGAAAEADVNKDAANEQKLDADLKGIQSRYDAARDKVVGPLYASLKGLGISESGTPQKTVDAGIVIVKKINAEYEKFCPAWWGASGPFNEWLKRYKEHLVQDHIPYIDNLETAKAVQFTMFGIPADKFQSTVAMQTVVKYMSRAQKVFNYRLGAPQEDLIIP